MPPAGTWTPKGYKGSLPVLFLIVVLVVLVVFVLRLVALLLVVANADTPLDPRKPVFYAPPTSAFHRDIGVAVGQRASVD